MNIKKTKFLDLKKVKLVILDNFYDVSESSFAQTMYAKILNWKIDGYKNRYQDIFIPVDQADHFSKHYVFCFDEGGDLIPFSGQRYINFKKCEHFNVEFPLLTTVRNSGCKRNLTFLNNLIQKNKTKKRELIYPSGFTLSSNLAGLSLYSQFGADTTAAIHYWESLKKSKVEFITASVNRFKTYRLLKSVGHQFGRDEEGVLPHFPKKQAGNEMLRLMHTDTLDNQCQINYEKYIELFEKAEIIDKASIPNLTKWAI